MARRLARSAPATLVALAELLFAAPARNWLRSPLLVTPALGSVTLLLLTAGAAAAGGQAARNVLADEAAQASVVRFYLRTEATQENVQALSGRLAADPRVVRVRYVSAAQALAEASTLPGLGNLASDAGGNPYPASLEVTVGSLADVEPLVDLYASDPNLDPDVPSSYDAGAYSSARGILKGAAIAVAAVLAVLALTALLLVINAVRAAAVARAEEIAVMRLVGSSETVLRFGFAVEGGLTGAAGGICAGLLLLGLALALSGVTGVGLAQMLPGISDRWLGLDAILLSPAGIALGGLAGALALRRLPA